MPPKAVDYLENTQILKVYIIGTIDKDTKGWFYPEYTPKLSLFGDY